MNQFPNIEKMFQTQREVDKLIRETQKIEEDTVDRKIIAFKVEFGEFLNEHKGFKYWKKQKEVNKVLLLDEFADCIAFMLALAIEKKWDRFIHALEVVDLEDKTLSALSIDIFHNPLSSAGNWFKCLLDLLQMAFLVGLTVSDIEFAYEIKSMTNLERQRSGY
jgi:dimeric dUTPase (all-alpha-NTP-PPase superfamily)